MFGFVKIICRAIHLEFNSIESCALRVLQITTIQSILLTRTRKLVKLATIMIISTQFHNILDFQFLCFCSLTNHQYNSQLVFKICADRGGPVIDCRTPDRGIAGSRPTAPPQRRTYSLK